MKVNAHQMAEAADRASELLRSLGNRHRLLILCHLVEGESSVGDLTSALGIRDTNVSQHLALLRRDGLVRTRRDGQTIWYSVVSEPARRVLETLFEIFCKPASICEPPARARRSKPSPRATDRKR